jgi:glutamate synthase (ferredoxin)
LSNEISKIYGAQGLPDDTILVDFEGSAGQSFGAFATNGLSFKIHGNCNDYLGKGLSGGKLIIRFHLLPSNRKKTSSLETWPFTEL